MEPGLRAERLPRVALKQTAAPISASMANWADIILGVLMSSSSMALRASSKTELHRRFLRRWPPSWTTHDPHLTYLNSVQLSFRPNEQCSICNGVRGERAFLEI